MFASLLGWGFELVGLAALGIIIIFFLMRFINRKAGESWWHLFRTKVGQAGSYANSIDPAGQMEQAALDAAEELKSADAALIGCTKLRSQLTRQVEQDTLQANRLRAQLKQLLDSGAADTDSRVVDKAKRLRGLEKAIKDNTEQAESQETVYANTLKNANAAAQRIQAAQLEAKRLKVQLNMGAETVKLAAMLQKYDPTAVHSQLSKIDQYREAAQDKLDGYSATSKVMADRSAALSDDMEEVEDVSDVLASIRGTDTVVKKDQVSK